MWKYVKSEKPKQWPLYQYTVISATMKKATDLAWLAKMICGYFMKIMGFFF